MSFFSKIRTVFKKKKTQQSVESSEGQISDADRDLGPDLDPGISQDRAPAILAPLEELPHELMWKIVEYAPETVRDLSLASRVIRSCIDDYSKLRATIPIVQEFRIGGSENQLEWGQGIPTQNPGEMSIKICVPESKAGMFELRLRQRLKRIKRKIFSGLGHAIYTLDFNADSFKDEEGWKIIDHLHKCVGENIGTAAITHCSAQYELAVADSLLAGKRFQHLRVKLSTLQNGAATHVLKTIDNHKIEKLTLSLTYNSVNKPIDLLRELSVRLRELCLIQVGVDTTDFMFGIRGVTWYPTIIEMLENKIDKLWLRNDESDPSFFNDLDYDTLIERLPKLGKKIWFETNCYTRTNVVNRMDNEHEVKAIRNPRGMNRMTIKHASRVHESFS